MRFRPRHLFQLLVLLLIIVVIIFLPGLAIVLGSMLAGGFVIIYIYLACDEDSWWPF